MNIQELIPVGGKTTMRIGGKARYYADIATKEDIEEAVKFARSLALPIIPLGGGSNTIFADDVIEALVIRIKADAVSIGDSRGTPQSLGAPTMTRVIVQAGKILASLINELAEKNLDLSALTGIPGTIGGAIFGNAGQGPGGIWIGNFVENVTVFIEGQWKRMTKKKCDFRYRESWFKDFTTDARRGTMQRAPTNAIIWETTLKVPSCPAAEVKAEVHRLLQCRIETQPHLKTAGSCFKALPDGTPAWKLIDAAGLRGFKIGDVQIALKHANFLLNVGKGSFEDAVKMVEKVKEKIPEIAGVEMRFFDVHGRIIP